MQVITPNPKTSGGARWNYLAAWAWAERQPGGNEESAREFVRQLYKNVPVLDTGARGALTTFAQRAIGDVAISWENEAHLALREMSASHFEIVVPSISVLAEPSVAVVDKVVLRRGTREVAQAYLEFLYTPEGQEIAAKNFYRPRNQEIAAKYASQFAQELVGIDHFGGWKLTQKTHFATGGIFDQIHELEGSSSRSGHVRSDGVRGGGFGPMRRSVGATACSLKLAVARGARVLAALHSRREREQPWAGVPPAVVRPRWPEDRPARLRRHDPQLRSPSVEPSRHVPRSGKDQDAGVLVLAERHASPSRGKWGPAALAGSGDRAVPVGASSEG